MYIYIWPNSKYRNHWEKEIYSILSDTYKWTKTNKYLDEQTIYHYVFGYAEDVFIDNFDYYIDKIETLEDTIIDTEENNINSQDMLTFIKDYFKWLSKELSEHGKVLSNQVYNKINELLLKYSKDTV